MERRCPLLSVKRGQVGRVAQWIRPLGNREGEITRALANEGIKGCH